MDSVIDLDEVTAEDAYSKIKILKEHLVKVLRGKDDVIDLAITTLLSRGHLLIEDVPGVGKTTLGYGLARSIDCTFQRIQFTSDLLPSDLIGVTVYNRTTESFDFRRGPIFAGIVLADEINRSTPKTQSALLEAMNERQVSVEGVTHHLPEPFMIIATQNPHEYSGTFPLPESQLDRFTMNITIGYPDADHELEILRGVSDNEGSLGAVLTGDDLAALQHLACKVHMDNSVGEYLLRLVTATRESSRLSLGVSPRGSIALYSAAKGYALLKGRDFVTPDDIKALAVPVFSHRVITAEGSLAEGSEEAALIIEDLLNSIQVPV